MSESPTASEGGMISFKVKTAATEGSHELSLPESTTVLELKNKLGGKDYEDIPATRMRLIYSGRVLKDDQPLSTYKIKAGNTIHMVKSAAPSTAASTSGSTPAVPAVPQNIAAGTAHNPLSDLTGARYAGQVNLPSRSMFGADGGMGAPPSEDALAEMMSDPNTAQMMNEALSDPRMIDMIIQNDPTLRSLGPQARELLTSPMFRQMMTNPDMIRQAASVGRGMRGGGGGGGFAAPGGVPTALGSEGAAQSPPEGGAAANPFAALMSGGGMGAGGMPSPEMMRQAMQMMGSGSAGGFGGLGAGNAGGNTPADPSSPLNTAANSGSGNAAGDAGANPFAALFGAPPGAGAHPFMNGLPAPTPEQIQQAMAMFQQLNAGGAGSEGAQLPPFLGLGGTGAAPAAPADTRPPEEQYAEQLRQLNDMGFFDFEENVRALRRAGGSVQGAINQLLG